MLYMLNPKPSKKGLIMDAMYWCNNFLKYDPNFFYIFIWMIIT